MDPGVLFVSRTEFEKDMDGETVKFLGHLKPSLTEKAIVPIDLRVSAFNDVNVY